MGIRGSMIILPDGMVVASDVVSGLEEEQAAAMASQLILVLRSSLQRTNLGDFSRFVMTSSHGKIIFVEAGQAYLMAVVDPGVGLEEVMLDVLSAARKIGKLGSMTPAPRDQGIRPV